jgi:hypothetical protein
MEIFGVLQDGLAQMLLSENYRHADGVEPLRLSPAQQVGASEPTSGRAASAAISTVVISPTLPRVDPQTIGLVTRFPNDLHSQLGQLLKHATSEATKALTKYRTAEAEQQQQQKGENAAVAADDQMLPFGSAAGLVLKESLAHAWFGRYRASLQRQADGGITEAESTLAHLPKKMSAYAAVTLCAMIEYFTAELLELGGNAARDWQTSWISPMHLCLAWINDEELVVAVQTVMRARDERRRRLATKELHRALEAELAEVRAVHAPAAKPIEQPLPVTYGGVSADQFSKQHNVAKWKPSMKKSSIDKDEEPVEEQNEEEEEEQEEEEQEEGEEEEEEEEMEDEEIEDMDDEEQEEVEEEEDEEEEGEKHEEYNQKENNEEDQEEAEEEEEDDGEYSRGPLQHTDVIFPFAPLPEFDSRPPSQRVSLRGRRLQVIVKLSTIVLTPVAGDKESTCYTGGSWHVEGMENEAIVASAIVYLESHNITESRLAFRHAVALDEPEQDDARSGRELYGINDDGECNQELGSVVTQGGRAVAFPNLYQHQVQPFRLADASKPGHRKILVFFLVDPTQRIVSTSTVPPQQRAWAEEYVRATLRPLLMSATPLIEPLVDLILGYDGATDNTITHERALKERLELMTERSQFMDENTEQMFSRRFSFCEH